MERVPIHLTQVDVRHHERLLLRLVFGLEVVLRSFSLKYMTLDVRPLQ